jgi:phosphosulfolactate synthase
MHYHLTQIPERIQKPRSHGLTMVMDKGLSTREVENFIEVSGPYVL